MKTIYLIGGTMGIGKTTTCQALKKKLPKNVFLDGDWCWDADPFVVTEEIKQMVMDNICYLLNQFIHCSEYETVIFCWVMHRQRIIDEILSRIDTKNCFVENISLICEEKELRKRLELDVENGIRTPDVIERSVQRIELYRKLNTRKIDTTNQKIEQVVECICNL